MRSAVNLIYITLRSIKKPPKAYYSPRRTKISWYHLFLSALCRPLKHYNVCKTCCIWQSAFLYSKLGNVFRSSSPACSHPPQTLLKQAFDDYFFSVLAFKLYYAIIIAYIKTIVNTYFQAFAISSFLDIKSTTSSGFMPRTTANSSNRTCSASLRKRSSVV